MKKVMETILANEPIFFCSNSEKMIRLDSKVFSTKKFSEFTLPSRLSSLEIQTTLEHFEFVPHDEVLYLISTLSDLSKDEHYLVLHFSENREKAESYIFWDNKNWHFSTELFNPQIRFKWNPGIIFLY